MHIAKLISQEVGGYLEKLNSYSYPLHSHHNHIYNTYVKYSYSNYATKQVTIAISIDIGSSRTSPSLLSLSSVGLLIKIFSINLKK